MTQHECCASGEHSGPAARGAGCSSSLGRAGAVCCRTGPIRECQQPAPSLWTAFRSMMTFLAPGLAPSLILAWPDEGQLPKPWTVGKAAFKSHIIITQCPMEPYQMSLIRKCKFSGRVHAASYRLCVLSWDLVREHLVPFPESLHQLQKSAFGAVPPTHDPVTLQ